MIKQRIEYLDSVKAFAIVLMMLGHCYWKESVPYLNAAIYSFHMPLFFIISGFFIKPLRVEEAIHKYFLAYIKPYILTSVVILALIAVMDYFCESKVEYFKDWLLRVSFASGSDKGKELFASMPIIGALWFLPALFWANLIYSILIRRLDGIELFSIICLLFVVSYCSVRIIRLPFSIQAGISATLFLWIGNKIRQFAVVDTACKSFAIIGSMFAVWLICIVKGGVSVSHCVYGLGLISVLGAISASLLIFCVFKKYPALSGLGGGKIGQHTLLILCIHEVCLYYQFIYGNPFALLPYNHMVNLLIEFVLYVFIAFGGTFVINEIKFIVWKK